MTDRFRNRGASGALGLILIGAALCGAGQAAAQAGVGSVAFVDSPELSPVAQALPRLVGDSPALQSINADLAALDARDSEAFRGCSQWTRDVTQPMTGPRYITVQINEDKRCEGEFKGVDLFGLTYDLATGAQLDWTSALPRWTLKPQAGSDYGLWSSVSLSQWFSRRLLDDPEQDSSFIEDCGALFQPAAYAGLKFKIFLDAEQDALMVMAVQPDETTDCFTYAYLRDDELQTFGLDAGIVAALHAAHEAHNWNDGTARPGGSRGFQN